MSKNLGVFAAILALCCAFMIGPVSQARAAECTTQGALALALADVLGIQVTSAQAAADALTALGVAPEHGWAVDACLTEAVALEISQAFAKLNRDHGDFDRAMGMLGSNPDQQYPKEGSPISPFKPQKR